VRVTRSSDASISKYGIVSPAVISNFSIYQYGLFDISSCRIFTCGVKKSWNFLWNFSIFHCAKIVKFYITTRISESSTFKFHVEVFAFHRIKMHISKTLKKTWPLKFRLGLSHMAIASLNIVYYVVIVSKLKTWYRIITIARRGGGNYCPQGPNCFLSFLPPSKFVIFYFIVLRMS